MIVWIAERVFPFEGREVLAVCASEKLARELVTADVDDDGDHARVAQTLWTLQPAIESLGDTDWLGMNRFVITKTS